MPYASSRKWMCCETAGCVMFKSCAARVKFIVWQTQRKVATRKSNM